MRGRQGISITAKRPLGCFTVGILAEANNHEMVSLRVLCHFTYKGVDATDIHLSSSSRMCFMSHNWSATKQCLHPQRVAEISRHSVLSGDRIRQCETSSGSRHKDTDQCQVAISAVSLFCARTVQQKPLLLREVETRLPDCVVTH